MKNITKGDVITLKDEQTIADVREETGKLVTGLDMTVSDILTIREANGVCSWKRIRFSDSEVTLIIKECDGEFDVRACFVPEGFEAGDRRDLVESGWFEHLFDPVDDEIGLIDCDFHRYVHTCYEDEGEVEFAIKGGVLYGKDNNGRFCGVAEWSTTQECSNPEIICFEIGGEDAEHGGYVDLYQGVNLFPEEYEIL